MRRATRDMILKWHDAGYGVDETARLLKLTEREVEDVIAHSTPRQHKAAQASPDFIQPDILQPHRKENQ